MINVGFRVDASQSIGGGHVVRSLALADEFAKRGAFCTFLTRTESSRTIPWMRETKHDVIEIDLNHRNENLAGDLHREFFDVIVLDGYQFSEDHDRIARNVSDMVVVIDDSPKRIYDADIIIDPTYGREKTDYARLAPKAEVICGSEYALIRGVFAKLRHTVPTRRRFIDGNVNRILISFGASDSDDYTALATSAVLKMSRVGVDVIVGGGYPGRGKLSSLEREYPDRLRVWQNKSDVESVFIECDLAVGGAGVQTWERCSMGLPSIFVEMADNQKNNSQALTNNRAGVMVTSNRRHFTDELECALEVFLKDGEKVKAYSKNSYDLCDGLGAVRTVDEIFKVADNFIKL